MSSAYADRRYAQKMRELDAMTSYHFSGSSRELAYAPEPAPSQPKRTPEQRIQDAHDGVEDAQLDLRIYRRRWRLVLAGLFAGIASVMAGSGVTWIGLWGLGVPVIVIGAVATIVGFIATADRFANINGPEKERALVKAQRRLRDELTRNDEDES